MPVEEPVRHVRTDRRFGHYWKSLCGRWLLPRAFENDGPPCPQCQALDAAPEPNPEPKPLLEAA